MCVAVVVVVVVMAAIIAVIYNKSKSFVMTSMLGSSGSVTTTATSTGPNSIVRTRNPIDHQQEQVITDAQPIDKSDFLEYPRDFFNVGSGANPKTDADAIKLWPFRKNRPAKGSVDQVTASGSVMMAEVKAMRTSLRAYVHSHCLEDIRLLAEKHGLVRKNDNASPVSLEDFKTILIQLPNTEENNRLVYEIFHKSFRNRHWQSAQVDNWMNENKMKLLPAPPVSHKKQEEDEDNDTEEEQEQNYGREQVVARVTRGRNYVDERGGFGAVARQAKGEAIGQFMAPMFKRAGWYVAVTNKVGHGLQYKPAFDGQHKKFYVVTQAPGISKLPPGGGRKVNALHPMYWF